eukprot:4478811-Alexandrium_andersonii.AAC.1
MAQSAISGATGRRRIRGPNSCRAQDVREVSLARVVAFQGASTGERVNGAVSYTHLRAHETSAHL